MSVNLLIIDPAVLDYEQLLEGVDEATDILTLDAYQNGIDQIRDYLNGKKGYDSIQILSHGTEASITLGSMTLNSDNLDTYADELADIGESLAEEGDILLYGCNVAAGTDGQDFIQRLAAYTGADIAASDDITGKDGDWVLEASTGVIEESNPFSTQALSEWQGNLAPVYVNWSSLLHGYTYDTYLYDPIYHPDGAILRFDERYDGTDIAAYELYAEALNDELTAIFITDLVTYKTVYFYVDVRTITTSNFIFDDGSQILVGDNLYTTYGDDDGHQLTGGAGHDQIFGLGGNDTLSGGDGWDAFFDASGNNVLNGGAGDDWFDVYQEVGSASTVTGGAGNDFYYLDDWSPALLSPPATAGHDYVVTDFTPGANGDVIYVSDLEAISFGYTDQDPFEAGYLRIYQSGNNTLVQGDRDGSAGTVYGWMTLITLQNVQATSLTTDNFPGLGTVGDDSLVGTFREDFMNGSSGNDTISGLGGNDQVSGGLGDDLLIGGQGADKMYGGSGADHYYVDNAGDEVTETDNNPSGTSGLKLGLDPGSTIDKVTASVDYTLGAYVENLELTGSATDATGNSLDNELTGNDANNSLSGLGGNDTLTGGLGNDTLDGGEGTDIAIFSGLAAAYSITEGDSQTTVSGADGMDVLISIENLQFDDQTLSLVPITGTAGDDTLTGTSSNETLYGRGGNDTLDGGLGSDRLVGNLGADSLMGGEGDDTLDGGLGNDTLDGGDDVDTAFYGFAQSSSLTGVTVDLTKTTAQNTILVGFDTLLNIENIDGSQFNDTLIGNGANNVLSGAQGEDSLVGNLGADTLYGRAQNDTLVGGAGDDRLIGNIRADYLSGGSGNDTLDGGLGHDTLDGGLGTRDRAFYGFAQSSNSSGVTIDLRLTTAQNTQLAGFDTLVNIEQVQGGRFNDSLLGNGENNVLRGMQGHDTLVGNLGNDILQGGIGKDVLSGGAGNDVFDAGWGADTVTGGLGADTFVYQTPDQGTDTLTDFNAAQGDKFQFMSANFGDITTGVLASNHFTANTSGLALDTDDYFVFNTSNNTLSYDADGSGAGAPVNLALITNGAVLKNTDIVIA